VRIQGAWRETYFPNMMFAMSSYPRDVVGRDIEPSIADILRSLPDISGPEFDEVFEEIERLRQHPIIKRVRDIEL
jgi:hypothetical protein